MRLNEILKGIAREMQLKEIKTDTPIQHQTLSPFVLRLFLMKRKYKMIDRRMHSYVYHHENPTRSEQNTEHNYYVGNAVVFAIMIAGDGDRW